ncbi:hypothetical protein JW926_15270 [Candidatus Sumerlaeota bacterium]|nr:hypothetical protein [Candidatus Sumerlaeota bacterium]
MVAIMRKCLFIFCIGCFVIVLPFNVSANPYGVEIWESSSRQTALEKQGDLLQQGFSPVGVYYDGTAYQVIIGKYEDVMTPLWIIKKLPEINAFGEIVSLKDRECLLEALSGMAGLNQIPNSISLVLFKESPLEDSLLGDERSEIKQFSLIYPQNSPEEAESYIDTLLSQATGGDPIAGWAMLRKAYLQYKKQDKVSSEASFRAVAEGSVPRVKRHCEEALFRLGFVYAGQKRKIESFQAFELLKKLTGDLKQKALAQVQQSGIVMEIARGAEGGAGTLEDCRNSCLKVLDYVSPREAPQTCATAELMILETWYYEQNFTKAIELGVQFLEKYPEQTREYSMATMFIGMALDNTGNYAEAVPMLEKVFSLDFSQKGSAFGQNGTPWDMKQKAAEWIQELARKNKDRALLQNMSVKYPDYFTSNN